MVVTVVGLGLIGASICKDLIKKGYIVYGVDNNLETLEYASKNNITSSLSNNLNDYIDKSDVIIFAIYPTKLIEELKKYKFKENQVISDVTGIKEQILKEVDDIVYPAKYCSCHPMAGREKVGIKESINNLFKDANLIIIKDDKTDIKAINIMKKIGLDLEFKNIMITDSHTHDLMIGFTSTLTHAIACALVNSDNLEDTKYYIGDSYRDLTRIAMINNKLWTELFFLNKDNLIKHINNFEKELDLIKSCLINEDDNLLNEIFIKAKNKRLDMEKNDK